MTRNVELRQISERLQKLPLGEGHSGNRTKDPAPKTRTVSEPSQRLKQILLAYDASQGAQDSLEWAELLAGTQNGSVLAAMIVPETPKIWGGALTGLTEAGQVKINQLLKQEEQFAKKHLNKVEQALVEKGINAKTRLEQGSPGEQICRVAQEEDADLVVVGSHGKRGLEKLFLGSVSDVVKDRAGTSVLITRGPPRVRRIILAVDGSAHSRRAAEALEGFAAELDADVHIVHVLPLPFAPQSISARGLVEDLMQDVHDSLESRYPRDEGKVHYDVLFGNPADRILDHAQEIGAGLIVMGARGTTRGRGILTGSVSNRVAHQSKISVLIIRDKNKDPEE
jgi:nucleotide-binding universal stress UspA family protein